MANRVSSASTPTRPDPNAAVRRELARTPRSSPPIALLLVLSLLAVGGIGLGSVLSQPGDLLATAQSGQEVLQDTDSHFTWSSGWKVERMPSASGGTVHVSGRAGANASIVFYGTYVQILGPTGRGSGSVRVTLDGKTTSVSTHANTFHPRHVIFAASLTGSRHTLNVQVAGTALHPFVSIDAVVVSGSLNALADSRNRRITTPSPLAPPATPKPIATPVPPGTSTLPTLKLVDVVSGGTAGASAWTLNAGTNTESFSGLGPIVGPIPIVPGVAYSLFQSGGPPGGFFSFVLLCTV
ncbi:MAG: hypothetical protein ACREMY_13895, partial [bacterium]